MGFDGAATASFIPIAYPPTVAKCHGYDGYIRVNLLASWGKILGESSILQNQAFWWEILYNV